MNLNSVAVACVLSLVAANVPVGAQPLPQTVPTVDSAASGVPQTGRHADAIRKALKQVKLPPGFAIELYAVVPDAGRMAVSPADYGVFVGTRKKTVWVVNDPEGEARPDEVKAFTPSLAFDMPEGVCITSDRFLVVVERNRVRTISTMEFFEGGSKARVVEVVPKGQLIATSTRSAPGGHACSVGSDKQLYVALDRGAVRLDPFGSGPRNLVAEKIEPAVYSGSQFPQKYRGGVFSLVAGASGSARLTFAATRADGSRESAEVFATRWPTRSHPADVAELYDGSLLVSDDAIGAVYRIIYVGK